MLPTTSPFAKLTAALSPTAFPRMSKLTIVADGMFAIMPPSFGSNNSAIHVVPAITAPPIRNLINRSYMTGIEDKDTDKVNELFLNEKVYIL